MMTNAVAFGAGIVLVIPQFSDRSQGNGVQWLAGSS